MGLRTLLKRFRLQAVWSKYGLIVVGNIVFFVLLYLFSYRPHNEENRASEFLSTAQLAETRERKETAVDLYEKIVADYAGTRAAETAKARLPVLKKSLSKKPVAAPAQPAACEEINIEEMLRKGPGVYIATYVAKHFAQFPNDRSKLIEIISKYLKMALESEGIPLKQLRGESELQGEFFQSQFFELQPKCKMTPDWIFDDFEIENTNFFRWNNATVTLTVSQGGKSAQKIYRSPAVMPKESVEMLELRIRDGAGPVLCDIEVKSDEGRISIKEEL